MKSRKTQIILAVVLGLFLILFPLGASALPGVGFSTGFGAAVESAGGLDGLLTWFTTTIITRIVGPLVEFFVGLLNSFINQTNYYPNEVEASWGMMRNFVNLFFILVLIIMAFGTIFDLQKYNLRSLLPRFLVAALLINFSFVIGVYIIGVGNGLSKIFLGTVGDLMTKLGEGLRAAKITEVQRSLGGGFGALTTGVLFIIFLIITLFAFATSAIFVLLRIPFLWFLLILSPVAWIGSVLPNFKAQTWDNWWKQFIGWVFFLPIYLFFLMFASIFINARLQIVPGGGGATTGLGRAFALFGVNDIFMFVITIIFMVGGLGLAMKVGYFAGAKATEYFGKIETGVGRITGRVTSYSALKKGLVQTGARIKEEGLSGRARFLYGGERAERLKTAGVAQFFGAKGEYAKVKLAETEKERERLRQIMQRMTPEKAQEFLDKERRKKFYGVRGNAAVLEHAKQGYAEMKDYDEAMGKFGGEHTLMGREYLKNIKEAKFSRLFETSDQELALAKDEAKAGGFRELARALAQDLAEKDRITNKEDFAELKKLLDPVPKELRNFMNAIKPGVVYGTRELRQAALFDPDLDKDLVLKLINFMKEKKEISAMRDDAGNIIPGSDVKIRNKVMEILGNGVIEAGKHTTEGRSVINEIDKFNLVTNIRADNPTLSPAAIADKIHAELEKKAPEEAAKFAVDLFKDPEARAGIKRLISDNVWDADFLKELTNKSAGTVKSEIKKIKTEMGIP